MRVVGSLAEACEHIRELHVYCKEHDLEIDACGDCETPWVVCRKCDVELVHAYLGREGVEGKGVEGPEWGSEVDGNVVPF